MICGTASWTLSPVLPVGLDIVAIVLGFLALRQARKESKKERLIAHIGLWAGLIRLIAAALTFLWMIVAFMLNPVAH